MKYEIKQLGIGGILDQAITLLKDNFGQLLALMSVLWVPSQLAIGLLNVANMPQIPEGANFLEALEAQIAAQHPLAPILTLVVFTVVYPLTNAAMVYTVARLYLGKAIGVGEAYGRALQVILPLIGTVILWYLAIVGGVILCIIPGILFFFWFILWSQVVIIEGVSGFAALKRSKFLMTGNIGTVFVLSLLLGLINITISVGIQFIPNPYVTAVLQAAVSAGLVAFGVAAMVVFYFSCRCKAESFDLELLAAAVGTAPSTDPADDLDGNLFDE